MVKSYLLGLPLFNVGFLILGVADLWIYRIQNVNNPNAAPATLTTVLFIILLYGGFIVVSFLFGILLFSKYGGEFTQIALYSFFSFLISAILWMIEGLDIHNGTWVIVSLQQGGGFLFGAIFGAGRHRRKN